MKFDIRLVAPDQFINFSLLPDGSQMGLNHEAPEGHEEKKEI
jgi:hypothetical protein